MSTKCLQKNGTLPGVELSFIPSLLRVTFAYCFIFISFVMSDSSNRAQALLQLTEAVKKLSDSYYEKLIDDKEFRFMFDVIYIEFNHVRAAQKKDAELMGLSISPQ